VNSGNSHAPTTWNVAHLTFLSGATGIFVPSELDLSINGGPAQPVFKGSAPGSTTCFIFASQDGFFTLSGTVTGKIVQTG
jgi:hypothetical protein